MLQYLRSLDLLDSSQIKICDIYFGRIFKRVIVGLVAVEFAVTGLGTTIMVIPTKYYEE